jgi:hypothetical protein
LELLAKLDLPEKKSVCHIVLVEYGVELELERGERNPERPVGSVVDKLFPMSTNLAYQCCKLLTIRAPTV